MTAPNIEKYKHLEIYNMVHYEKDSEAAMTLEVHGHLRYCIYHNQGNQHNDGDENLVPKSTLKNDWRLPST